jgi:hypothetical protein
VLELAAGDEHEGIGASGRSSAGMMSAGTSFTAPSSVGKRSIEDDRLAGSSALRHG